MTTSQPVTPEVLALIRRRGRASFEKADDIAALCADIEERSRIGIEHYGTELMTFNGRDAVRDLYEELLDALVYLKQAQMEGDPAFWGGGGLETLLMTALFSVQETRKRMVRDGDQRGA